MTSAFICFLTSSIQHLETIKEEVDMVGSDMSDLFAAAAHQQQLSPHGSVKSEKDSKTGASFWPKPSKVDTAVKNSTVLTNLQRGNIPTILQV